MDYSFVEEKKRASKREGEREREEGRSEGEGEGDEKEGRPNHANGYTNLTQQDVARGHTLT